MSDLMAGLMIVFLFIAVSYMIEVRSGQAVAEKRADDLQVALTSVSEERQRSEDLNRQLEEQKGELLRTNEKIKEIAATYSEIQNSLYTDLQAEFRADLPRWNATLERDNTIRFNEPEVLFQTGQADIRPRFQTILKDFFPRYLKIIYKGQFRDEIDEIRIEGHTSSVWKDATSKQDRYLKNAQLSQSRALQVLDFCFGLDQSTDQRDLLIRDLRANGLSFARPIFNPQGKEEEDRSQRVEFRVVTKTRDRILKILEAGDEQPEK
ncbi:OmpA family protein [Luteolibacter sp. GHJ8]|uniref:OmpA family protein n=1 Tax=Luteolibacter rhizosphaerae TaxID=2989719 RepID=A0ABT3FZM4_9BACT|nr:OmpA family protein [Luteolibacter rhizosphaerae]MCW1913023.1 OmpA family protein [Luteolibacter rhizosphaerae]